MKKCHFILLVSFLAFSLNSKAQFGYSPSIVKPILEDDVMFRKYVIRSINFKEKQNMPFVATGFVFPEELINAIKAKKIEIYTPFTSLSEPFLDRINIDKDTAWDKGYSKVSTVQNGVSVDEYITIPLGPEQMRLEILEEVVFDKRRSRMYINIIALNLVGMGVDQDGGDRYIGTVKYKDADKYFRQQYVESNQKEGRWYNPKNERRHMCVMDAFELRLFSSRIIKVSNPEDSFLSQLYKNPIEELYKAQEAEMELMEFEHNLWEF